ncbi:DUF6688 domain-containing protein [Winogradskyella flava]|uniref:DUF6688 domain-containing protein n=1 Tax=Winogradskyella flava TaxID=1884876 RepID=UPI00249320FB|nr:DUF6688 family protein [Winogradskyella flava]
MSLAILFLLLITPSILVLINFVFYLIRRRLITNSTLWKLIEITTVVIFPFFFISTFDIFKENSCCTESAIFSPNDRLGIYTILIIYTFAYIITIFRKQLFPPISELLLNITLILGLVINILLIFHIRDIELGSIMAIVGNTPIVMLLLIRLIENQKLLTEYIQNNAIEPNGYIGKLCYSILKLKPTFKYPILLVLLIPVLIIFSLILVLFGQKPDTLVRGFTDTYRQGFSQLDYLCDNVECGGHFLCSVGANGHKSIVKPIRYGERNGKQIICNRQLLISNAFEELIHEKMPLTHRIIRNNYNKVGSFIHKYYKVFNIKIVSDIVYLMMKPLEWFFLLILYTFDKNPENRIAVQYLSPKDRNTLKNR